MLVVVPRNYYTLKVDSYYSIFSLKGMLSWGKHSHF